MQPTHDPQQDYISHLESELERAQGAWKGAMEERDYWERKYKELRALMPIAKREH